MCSTLSLSSQGNLYQDRISMLSTCHFHWAQNISWVISHMKWISESYLIFSFSLSPFDRFHPIHRVIAFSTSTVACAMLYIYATRVFISWTFSSWNKHFKFLPKTTLLTSYSFRIWLNLFISQVSPHPSISLWLLLCMHSSTHHSTTHHFFFKLLRHCFLLLNCKNEGSFSSPLSVSYYSILYTLLCILSKI